MRELLRMCYHFKKPEFDDIMSKAVEFGDLTKHKTLILDMDETMIESRFLENVGPEQTNIQHDGDFLVKVEGDEGGDSITISVKMRPYLDMCLEHLSKYYEIAVFTAGEQNYADAILDVLDESSKNIKHRLYR